MTDLLSAPGPGSRYSARTRMDKGRNETSPGSAGASGNRYLKRNLVDKGRKRSQVASTRKLSRLQWDILLTLALGHSPNTQRCLDPEAERTATLRALARLQQRGLVIRRPILWAPISYSLAVPIRVLYLAAADSSCPYAVEIADVLRGLAEKRERRGRR